MATSKDRMNHHVTEREGIYAFPGNDPRPFRWSVPGFHESRAVTRGMTGLNNATDRSVYHVAPVDLLLEERVGVNRWIDKLLKAKALDSDDWHLSGNQIDSAANFDGHMCAD